MSQAEYISLNPELEAKVEQALSTFKSAFELTLNKEGVMRRGNVIYIPVKPGVYPSRLFAFLDALSQAEMDLRDEGLDVRLTPEVRQRMVYVANVPGDGEYVFISTDGDEYEELERALGREVPSGTSFEGVPFDGEEEDEVKHEVLVQHPDARRIGLLAS